MVSKKKLCISIDANVYKKAVKKAEKLDLSMSAYINSILGNEKQIKNKQLEEFSQFKYEISNYLNLRQYMIEIGNKTEVQLIEKRIIEEVTKSCQLSN